VPEQALDGQHIGTRGDGERRRIYAVAVARAGHQGQRPARRFEVTPPPGRAIKPRRSAPPTKRHWLFSPPRGDRQLPRDEPRGCHIAPYDMWALTPLGEARLNNGAAKVSASALAVHLGQVSGSEFGEQHHTLIPPFLGPMGAAPGLSRILDGSPFEQNIMLITRFPKGPEDHYAQLIPELREAVAQHGLALRVASDGVAEDLLWANVVTYMWACKYAIVLMDTAS
jgi:hypothetical protein